MNKKLKIKIIILIVILITIIKIIQINFIEDIRIKINNFEKLENSYYIQILINEKQKVGITRIRKNKIIKEIYNYDLINDEIIKLINLNKNEILEINEKKKNYKIERIQKDDYTRLKNLPKILEVKNEIKTEIAYGNIFSIFNCFRILYIIPTKYNDIESYKIRTTREILYVDKQTLYPIFLEYNQSNSNNDNEKIRIEYIFRENTVKDEDIKIPDLNNYTLIKN